MQVSVSVENPIEDLLARFDFPKVHMVMQYLDWRWSGHAPSVEDLRAKAREMLLSLDPTTDSSIMTGGFHAYVRRGTHIGLSFMLAHSNERIPPPEIVRS